MKPEARVLARAGARRPRRFGRTLACTHAPRTPRVLLALVAAGAAWCAGPTRADELSGTLKKIHDDGVIQLGVREASIPFSYFDGQHTIGYSQAMALRIVEQIGKTLGMPALKVREVTVTSANRMPMLQNNQIDLECGTTTHLREREKSVAFSNSLFQYAIRMVTRSDSGIGDFADLAGKPVVTTAGTYVERLLRMANTDRHLNLRIIVARDHQQGFAALKENRVAAFVMDEPVLVGLRAADPHPDDFRVTGAPLGSAVYACMFRKGDEPFRKLVNGVIAREQVSGDAERLYRQWFQQPIPPQRINLDFPLSAQNRALFAHPNDRALD